MVELLKKLQEAGIFQPPSPEEAEKRTAERVKEIDAIWSNFKAWAKDKGVWPSEFTIRDFILEKGLNMSVYPELKKKLGIARPAIQVRL